jgi:arylsulfatase A-like enzyme
MTGRHTRRHGVVEVIEYWETDFHLPYSEVLVPRMLAYGTDLAYDTSFVGKWHLGTMLDDVGAAHPNEAGWAWYAGSFGNLGDEWFGEANGLLRHYTNWERLENGSWAQTSRYATTVTVDDAIGRMEAMTSPWLLVTSFNAGHSPFHVPPPELHDQPVTADSPIPDLLDAAMAALDTELARLLASVPDDTTVIVFGDNGSREETIRPPWSTVQDKGTITEGGTRVPFLVAGPLVRASGGTAGLVHVVDVFATIAQIAGVDLADVPGADGGPLVQDGIGLLPYLADPGRPSLRAVNYTDDANPNGPGPYDVDDRAVTDGRFKLVRSRGTGALEEALFDLGETNRETGPDLLKAPLAADAQVAYDLLTAELDRLEAEIVYDVPR